MPYDHCRKAARLFSSHLGVVRPAPVASTRRGLDHKREGVRPPESCASLRGQAGTLRRESCVARCRHKACVFPAQPGAQASARIIAASPQNLVASSPCNHRPCFSTRPNSACRIPSPTTDAYKIAIGWQSNECGFCWARLSSGIPRQL